MSEMLDFGIKKVGVFVNEDINIVNEISHICGLDIIQLHGEETPDYCLKIDRCVWKAFRIKDLSSLDKIPQYTVDAILLDTYSNDDYGGTGKAFDWKLTTELVEKYKIVLAGGLNLDNVEDAVKTLHPYCVDVSSGVELDGIKNEEKIKEFIQKVRMETC
jgi:phosphoribosylanthranilate isomerase